MAIDRKRIQRLERWREAVRRQEEARTREAFGVYQSSVERLERASGARRAVHCDLSGSVEGGATGADVRVLAGMWEGARQNEALRVDDAGRAASDLDARRQELISARRQERVLETLGERLEESERREQLLAEQKIIDDMTRGEVNR